LSDSRVGRFIPGKKAGHSIDGGRKIELKKAVFIFSSFFLYPEDGGDMSSETSVNAISTRLYIPEDRFLHSHRRENLKFYKNRIVPVIN
jgi:hypothetical protein